jgi:hypothetical protein
MSKFRKITRSFQFKKTDGRPWLKLRRSRIGHVAGSPYQDAWQLQVCFQNSRGSLSGEPEGILAKNLALRVTILQLYATKHKHDPLDTGICSHGLSISVSNFVKNEAWILCMKCTAFIWQYNEFDVHIYR